MACAPIRLAVRSYVVVALISAGPGWASAAPPPPERKPPVRLTTLTWPPYTDRGLPDGGAVTAVVRAAFAEMGRRVRVTFWPWKRAIARAREQGPAALGYFPGYHCRHDGAVDFARSHAIGQRPLGLAKRSDADRSWSRLADLENERIGTVVGYANTQAFERKEAAGALQTIESFTDRDNLHKLLRGRIDYAVIDTCVFEYLIRRDPKLQKHAGKLELSDKLLGTMPLFVCFRAGWRGEALTHAFNSGLARIDRKRILKKASTIHDVSIAVSGARRLRKTHLTAQAPPPPG